MLTDIEGSTRLLEEHTSALVGVIARHELLRLSMAAFEEMGAPGYAAAAAARLEGLGAEAGSGSSAEQS